MQPKFKKNDWCFCEYKLQQVKETEENRITSVTDGMFNLGSYDLTDRCFPLDLRVKQISDTVAHWSTRFHELKHNSLNHPDLNRALIERWVDMCENKDNDERLKELYKKLEDFGSAICNRVRDLRYEEVEGVQLFSR